MTCWNHAGTLLLAGGLLIAGVPAFTAALPAAAANARLNTPQSLVAEADALMRLQRPGEAIGVYRNALSVGARRDAVEQRLVTARSLRRTLLQTCLGKHGMVAERACEAAWLPGAPDEVAVFKQRGKLLQGNGDSSAALDAYMAAARLAPRDRAVAQIIVVLAARTGRKDQPVTVAFAAAQDRLRVADRAPAVRRAAPAPQAAAATVENAVAPSPGSFSNEAEVTRSN